MQRIELKQINNMRRFISMRTLCAATVATIATSNIFLASCSEEEDYEMNGEYTLAESRMTRSVEEMQVVPIYINKYDSIYTYGINMSNNGYVWVRVRFGYSALSPSVELVEYMGPSSVGASVELKKEYSSHSLLVKGQVCNWNFMMGEGKLSGFVFLPPVEDTNPDSAE